MSRVELRGIVKSFGTVQAVRDVSLDIPNHAFVTLLGPSGCGKTTTLNMIAGLEKITRGDIYLDQERINDWEPHERRMAMVFQNYALYPHMNVYGNIAFALRLARRDKQEIDRRVRRVATALELDALLERRIAQLSGGQQQRVALARAMVKEPNVFLFDEPLSNLDAVLRTRMRVEIKRLHQQLQTTSIFVTHDQEEAMILSDFIAVMRDGRIVQYGPAEEVYRYPHHFYVATFIGKPRMGTIKGTLQVTPEMLCFTADDLQLRWAHTGVNGRTIEPMQVPAILGIRAEDVRLHDGGDAATDVFVGQAELLEPLGSDTFVEVARADKSLTVRIEPDRRLKVGETVALQLPKHKLHFFHAETQVRINI